MHSTELSGRQRSADMAFFRAQRREILYRIIRTRITDDAGIDHTTYGMQCLGRRRGQWLEIDRIPDISLCRVPYTGWPAAVMRRISLPSSSGMLFSTI